MSEVTLTFRLGDPNRASKKGQKRPLSIITENDSDDPETVDLTKHPDNTDCSGKENTTYCKDVSEPNKNCQDGQVVSKLSDLTRIVKYQNSSSEFKATARMPYVSKKYLSTAPVFKSTKYHLTKLSTESRGLILESTSENATTPENVDGKCPDESFWKQIENTRSLSYDTKDTQSVELQDASSVASNNESLICGVTQGNSSSLTRPGLDGVSKLRGSSERLYLTSPLSSTSSSSPSPTLNGKFCFRTWQQTSTPNPQELSSSRGEHPVIISVTLVSSPSSDDISDNGDGENSSPSDTNNNNNNNNNNNSNNNINNNSKDNNLSSVFPKLPSSKLSSYFSRRMSNESIGSLSESDLSDGDDNPSTYLSYFRRLKETTDKLQLSARRPSIMQWRQQYLESQTFPVVKSSVAADICDHLCSDVSDDESLTIDRKHRIDRALEWLRNQLHEMRKEDQSLARQLLSIRHDIHKLKLQRSTEEHQELIDDFHYEVQELQEFSDILDLPIPEYSSNPLKQIGITRLNISARRFSAC